MTTPSFIRHLSLFSVKNALTVALLVIFCIHLTAADASAKCDAESAVHADAIKVRDHAKERASQAAIQLASAKLRAAIDRRGNLDLSAYQRELEAAQSKLDRAEINVTVTAEALKGCEAESDPKPIPKPQPQSQPTPNCDDQRKERDAAAADVDRARASLQLAEATLRRTERLVEAGAVSSRDLEVSRKQELAAKARLQEAESQLARTESALQGCETGGEVPRSSISQATIGLLPSLDGVSLLVTAIGITNRTYQLQKSADSIHWENLGAAVTPQKNDQQLAWTLVTSEENYRYLRQSEEIDQTRYSAGPVIINDGGPLELYRVTAIEAHREIIESPVDAVDKAVGIAVKGGVVASSEE